MRGEQGEEIAVQVAGAKLGAAGHQQGRAERRQDQRRALQRGRPAPRQPQPPGGKGEARDIAEQGRVAELGQVNAGVPGGKVGGEEESGDGDDDGGGPPRPVRRLAHGPRQQPEEGKRQR